MLTIRDLGRIDYFIRIYVYARDVRANTVES